MALDRLPSRSPRDSMPRIQDQSRTKSNLSILFSFRDSLNHLAYSVHLSLEANLRPSACCFDRPVFCVKIYFSEVGCSVASRTLPDITDWIWSSDLYFSRQVVLIGDLFRRCDCFHFNTKLLVQSHGSRTRPCTSLKKFGVRLRKQ